MSFATKLKTERQRLSLTQAEAAELLDVSKSALEKWEAGAKTPLAVTQEGALARLAKARENHDRGGACDPRLSRQKTTKETR